MVALTQSPTLFKLLADDVRWRIVLALARGDRRGQELVRALRRPQNLVSYHLQQLLKHKLVSQRRSAADRRDVYFSLRTETLRRLYAETGAALLPGPASPAPAETAEGAAQTAAPARVLFLCTHNSARSQMAEAILRHLSQGQIDVHSAGNEPSDIHPLARQVMRARGISLEGQRSKHLSEFAGQRFDYIHEFLGDEAFKFAKRLFLENRPHLPAFVPFAFFEQQFPDLFEQRYRRALDLSREFLLALHIG